METRTSISSTGLPLPGSKFDVPPKNALYRNNGDWRFTDVTEESHLGDEGYGMGVAVADYDNDGDQDVYLNNFGPKAFYRNNGNGTFTEVAQALGVRAGDEVGAGACFLDADRDGWLDLFSANYVKFRYSEQSPKMMHGYPVYPGPNDLPPDTNAFYRNRGDGTFEDLSTASGIGGLEGTGMGTVCLDFDNDDDTDIFVANDVRPDFLFRNDGRGRFEEVGLPAGVAYTVDGLAMASMGVACGDYNNDGWLDLFVTSYAGCSPALYRNTGQGFFEDVTRASGAGAGAFPYVNWGTEFVDFDNDGHRDLFLANGHTEDNVELFDDWTAYKAKNIVLRNLGDGRFENVSEQCGDGLEVVESSRGAAFDDLDGDGDIDVVVLNSRAAPTVLRNESVTENHWIDIRLQGTVTNRDAVGSRVTVIAGDLKQIDEVHSGRGYQSHYGTQLHFGLGRRNRVDRIEVKWLGQGTEVIENVEVDRCLTIVQSR